MAGPPANRRLDPAHRLPGLSRAGASAWPEGRQASRVEPARTVACGWRLAALAFGAYFLVFSTEQIASVLGISTIIGGLFIKASVAALHEVLPRTVQCRVGTECRRPCSY